MLRLIFAIAALSMCPGSICYSQDDVHAAEHVEAPSVQEILAFLDRHYLAKAASGPDWHPIVLYEGEQSFLAQFILPDGGTSFYVGPPGGRVPHAPASPKRPERTYQELPFMPVEDLDRALAILGETGLFECDATSSGSVWIREKRYPYQSEQWPLNKEIGKPQLPLHGGDAYRLLVECGMIPVGDGALFEQVADAVIWTEEAELDGRTVRDLLTAFLERLAVHQQRTLAYQAHPRTKDGSDEHGWSLGTWPRTDDSKTERAELGQRYRIEAKPSPTYIVGRSMPLELHVYFMGDGFESQDYHSVFEEFRVHILDPQDSTENPKAAQRREELERARAYSRTGFLDTYSGPGPYFIVYCDAATTTETAKRIRVEEGEKNIPEGALPGIHLYERTTSYFSGVRRVNIDLRNFHEFKTPGNYQLQVELRTDLRADEPRRYLSEVIPITILPESAFEASPTERREDFGKIRYGGYHY